MLVSTNTYFTIETFQTLDEAAKKAFYQEANEKQMVDLVRQLNEQGMKPEVPYPLGASILSNFMDIATKHDTTRDYLKELRGRGRLLTKEEFASLPEKNWIEKYKFSRMTGSDHLLKKIEETQSKHIKIPLKIAVIDSSGSFEMTASRYQELCVLSSDNNLIYAEEIAGIDRKFTRDEIDELFQVIEAANFVDLNLENFVLTQESVYFIDTEAKSFSGSVQWEKMGRFSKWITGEDQAYFEQKIQEKLDAPSTVKHLVEYDQLTLFYQWIEGGKIQDKALEAEVKANLARLDYVGGKRKESNLFKFNIKDLE